MHRTVAGISYDLTRTKVKNYNLRIRFDGTVAVSAPRRAPLRELDAFVASQAKWIEAARERMLRREKPSLPEPGDDACITEFTPYLDHWYPLFSSFIAQKPVLKVRWMKSRWGVCHPGKNYITLNKRLLYMPAAALEYVVVHELVHFLHPNHQAGFHAQMAALMPDYKARRALLREFP